MTVEVSYDELLNQKNVTRQAEPCPGDTLRRRWPPTRPPATSGQHKAQIGGGGVLDPDRPPHRARGRWTKPGAVRNRRMERRGGRARCAYSNGQLRPPWPGGQKNTWTFTTMVIVR